jgi:acetoacetyl-CoA synthetase
MATMVGMGDLLWTPSEALKKDCELSHFMNWLRRERGLDFASYDSLWRWSATEIEAFWQAVWDYFEISSPTPYDCVLDRRQMPGATWFPGAQVNYIEHLLAPGAEDAVAIHAAGEDAPLRQMTRGELRAAVRRLATTLREMGIQPGDRVGAYLPNIPEAAVAFFATAAIGAIWSSCSPDFGAASVTDRFSQISPKLLFVTDGYTYGGKYFDRSAQVREMIDALPSVEHVVQIPAVGGQGAAVVESAIPWQSLLAGAAVAAEDFAYARTGFNDPLWIVYSSGTTGLPKPFVHGHGGILLEALKFTHFHLNLKPESCMFYFTTTGWVMWNIMLSGLVAGAAVVMIDGHPMHPEPDSLWKLAQDTGMTLFGASPAWLGQQMKLGIEPAKRYDLSRLDSILLGGAPVMPEHMQWCYEHLHPDIWVTSQSGGTDVASGFVGGVPLLPVHAGEIQARLLGVDVHSLDDDGQRLIGKVGELVVGQPMPSMPLCFWGDEDGQRYFDSYFDVYPGQWRHGDYFKVNERGGCFILGRSDSTLNRHGVRIGTAEVYRVIEAIDAVQDSLIVNLNLPDGGFYMPLFIVLKEGQQLDDSLRREINRALREKYSPRHVPDQILQVEAVPYTLTGKKLEVPVRKILLGKPADEVASRDAMANPDSLAWFERYARTQSEYSLG